MVEILQVVLVTIFIVGCYGIWRLFKNAKPRRDISHEHYGPAWIPPGFSGVHVMPTDVDQIEGEIPEPGGLPSKHSDHVPSGIAIDIALPQIKHPIREEFQQFLGCGDCGHHASNKGSFDHPKWVLTCGHFGEPIELIRETRILGAR